MGIISLNIIWADNGGLFLAWQHIILQYFSRYCFHSMHYIRISLAWLVDIPSLLISIGSKLLWQRLFQWRSLKVGEVKTLPSVASHNKHDLSLRFFLCFIGAFRWVYFTMHNLRAQVGDIVELPHLKEPLVYYKSQVLRDPSKCSISLQGQSAPITATYLWSYDSPVAETCLISFHLILATISIYTWTPKV